MVVSCWSKEAPVVVASDAPAWAPLEEGSAPTLRPILLLNLCLRAWPQLRGLQGLGERPTVQALVYALSRLRVLTLEERAQLDLFRPLLPKALLALDAPAAEAQALWHSLPPAGDPVALAEGLQAAAARLGAGSQAQALALAARLVEVGRQEIAAAGLSPVGQLALARALAWGGLRGALSRGLSAQATACAAALRVLIAQLNDARSHAGG